MSGPGVAIANIDLSQRVREPWLGDWRDISNKERRTAPYKSPASPSSPSGEPPPPPPPDQIPPEVSLTSPAAGATLSGSVNVAASASDDVGVVRVTVPAGRCSARRRGHDRSLCGGLEHRDDRQRSAHTRRDRVRRGGHSASSSMTVNVSNGSTLPVAAVPGTIQAEDYDIGGEGVGYHDTTADNSGGQYRSDGVDIEAAADTGGGFDVGWMYPTEWLNYRVSVATAGTYTLTARVAAQGAGGTFHVEFAGIDVTGPLIIPNTGGWQAWTNVTATVTLAAGLQSMRVVVDGAGPTGIVGNVNYVRLENATPLGAAVPGTIQAEDYDVGGEGVAYHDTNAANSGGQYPATASISKRPPIRVAASMSGGCIRPSG